MMKVHQNQFPKRWDFYTFWTLALAWLPATLLAWAMFGLNAALWVGVGVPVLIGLLALVVGPDGV